MADEAYMLYPEGAEHLKRVQGTPAHQFFKRYGEAMPDGDWNHGGTKQGLYMIGPDGEYLEGKFAASGVPDDIKKRMERALKRWRGVCRQKNVAAACGWQALRVVRSLARSAARRRKSRPSI